MEEDKLPKNTMMPFNGDFYGSDGKTRNLDEFLNAISGGQNTPGVNGKSAYEIAVEHGFNGTEAEWLISLKGKDGEPSGGGMFKSVATFDDLPQPSSEYTGELYFVRESTGGALAFMGIYKYPRGFYAVNEDGEWVQVPLDLSVAEDAFTLVNITDWAAFRGFVKTINAGDAVLYDGFLYQNATGIITDEPPTEDADNWFVMQGLQGSDGKSAYEVAVGNGFAGDESAWLASLKGADGEQGSLLFTITGTTNAAPAGARVGDYIFNGSTTTSYTVGNRTLSPGFQSAITQLSPLQISATMTQYRGLTGATGAQGIQGIQGFKGDPGSALTEIDYIVSTSAELEGLHNNPNARYVMIKPGEYTVSKVIYLHANVMKIFGLGNVVITFEMASNTSACLRGNRYSGTGNVLLQTIVENITFCVKPASPSLFITVLSYLCVRNCTICAGNGEIGSNWLPLPARYTMMERCNDNANVLIRIPALGKGAFISTGLSYCFNSKDIAVIFESAYVDAGSGQVGSDDSWLGCTGATLTAYRQCTNISNCAAIAYIGISIYFPGTFFTKFPGTISVTGFEACNNIIGADTCFFVGDSFSSCAYARDFTRYDYKDCGFLSHCKGGYDLLSNIMSHNTLVSIPDDRWWEVFENYGWSNNAEYIQDYRPVYYQVTHKCEETCL